MPFNQKPQKFNAKINSVTIGNGDKTVTIGGENSFPFYSFDAQQKTHRRSVLRFLTLDWTNFPKA